MYGAFITDTQGRIALSWIDDERVIENLHVVADTKTVLISFTNGDEEMLVHEISDEMVEALGDNKIIYIGSLDTEGNVLSEYEATISVG